MDSKARWAKLKSVLLNSNAATTHKAKYKEYTLDQNIKIRVCLYNIFTRKLRLP